MALFEPRNAARELADLLQREREAILAARFDDLARMAERKEKLASRVANSHVPTQELRALRRRVERNHKLIDSMRLGLESATEKLKVLREKPDSLHTYDAEGRKMLMQGERRPQPKKT